MSYFRAKMHQIRFRLGLCPRPRQGSSQRSPDFLVEFKGSYFLILRKGRKVERGKEKGREEERGGRRQEERGRRALEGRQRRGF